MNRDPRFALSQELQAKQTLLDQLRALAADDPDFFTDLLEGETNLLELIAGLDASIVDDEIQDIPGRWWKPQPPKLDQDGLTKAIRARDKALKEAEALTDPEQRGRALAEVETLHPPPIPGVSASNGGITLIRRV